MQERLFPDWKPLAGKLDSLTTELRQLNAGVFEAGYKVGARDGCFATAIVLLIVAWIFGQRK